MTKRDWYSRETHGQYDSRIEYDCYQGTGTLHVYKSAPGEYVWCFEVNESDGHHGHSVTVHRQCGKSVSLSAAKLAAVRCQAKYNEVSK